MNPTDGYMFSGRPNHRWATKSCSALAWLRTWLTLSQNRFRVLNPEILRSGIVAQVANKASENEDSYLIKNPRLNLTLNFCSNWYILAPPLLSFRSTKD